MCGVVHTSIKIFADKFYEELVRRVYTTPKSYLDLINSYTAKLGVLQGAVETKAQQMEVRVEGALCVHCMVFFDAYSLCSPRRNRQFRCCTKGAYAAVSLSISNVRCSVFRAIKTHWRQLCHNPRSWCLVLTKVQNMDATHKHVFDSIVLPWNLGETRCTSLVAPPHSRSWYDANTAACMLFSWTGRRYQA